MLVSEFNTPRLTHLMNHAKDVFTGADGGIGYIRLCSNIRFFETLVAQGDPAAIEIISHLQRGLRSIEVLTCLPAGGTNAAA